MYKLIIPALVALTLGCTEKPAEVAPRPVTPKAVELIDVTYDGLDTVIATEKGNVVVVDVWGIT